MIRVGFTTHTIVEHISDHLNIGYEHNDAANYDKYSSYYYLLYSASEIWDLLRQL